MRQDLPDGNLENVRLSLTYFKGFVVDRLGGIVWLIAAVEELQGLAELAACAPAVGRGADGVVEYNPQSPFDLRQCVVIREFYSDDVDDFVQQASRLAGARGDRVAAGEALGKGAFEHPGGGPPMLGDRLLHGQQGAELGIHLGAADTLAELGISLKLAADGVDAATDIFGGLAEAAAGGYEGGDFVPLKVVELSRPAALRGEVRGRRSDVGGRWSGECGVWCWFVAHVLVLCSGLTRSAAQRNLDMGIAEVVAQFPGKNGARKWRRFLETRLAKKRNVAACATCLT